MSDKKRNEGMNEEIEITHADDLEETEEVVVFTKEEFEALMAEEGIDEDEELDEVPVFAFANADPYAKMEPRPEDAPKRDVSFDENGNIVVKNPSAF